MNREELLQRMQLNWEDKDWRLPQIVSFCFDEGQRELLLDLKVIVKDLSERTNKLLENISAYSKEAKA